MHDAYLELSCGRKDVGDEVVRVDDEAGLRGDSARGQGGDVAVSGGRGGVASGSQGKSGEDGGDHASGGEHL